MSDLIRSHEGNPDNLEGDPSKIRWGKYSMMARFVSTVMQCQAQCIATKDYSFVPRNDVKRLLETPCLMDEDVCSSFQRTSASVESFFFQIQQSRITPFDPTNPVMNEPRSSLGGRSGTNLTPAKEGIRKLFLL